MKDNLGIFINLLFLAAQIMAIAIVIEIYWLGKEHSAGMVFKWLGIGFVLAIVIRFLLRKLLNM
jgi:hypothetical protein